MDPQILERLRNNDPTLKSLKLGFNQIGPKDVNFLADALKHNKFLIRLDLWGIILDLKTRCV